MQVTVDSTGISLDVEFVDGSGLPLTGKVAADFPSLAYSLGTNTADVAFPSLTDLAALTTAYSAGGVKERAAGVYRLDCPNGMFAALGRVKVLGYATGKVVLCPAIDVVAASDAVQNYTIEVDEVRG